jgi:hypothetical protein
LEARLGWGWITKPFDAQFTACDSDEGWVVLRWDLQGFGQQARKLLGRPAVSGFDLTQGKYGTVRSLGQLGLGQVQLFTAALEPLAKK